MRLGCIHVPNRGGQDGSPGFAIYKMDAVIEETRDVLDLAAILTIAIVFAMPKNASAQQASSAGPYKVLKTAKVGGEGNWDYIYADAAGRRLYIPRRGGAGPAAAADPAVTPVPTRLTIFSTSIRSSPSDKLMASAGMAP